ncbi:hypothetical protein [Sulfurimonas sp.]|uniref:hypothetical protein n=1 Tax=Sulfurimonas sp. TaxID=2022749 RepID=UPI003562F469
MKIILLITILTLQVFALNPKVYSALGDKIYNKVDSIQELPKYKYFENEKQKIEDYAVLVSVIKNIGFNIDNGNLSVTKDEYLKKLRELAKTNDFYLMRVKRFFLNSIEKQNNNLFLEMIKTGLIDTTRYKPEIKKYYYEHKEHLDINGTVIEEFVAEDEKKKNKKKVYKGPTKEEIEKANIKRIRAKDKEKQEAIVKSLEEELKKKKEKIREEQKKELKTK